MEVDVDKPHQGSGTNHDTNPTSSVVSGPADIPSHVSESQPEGIALASLTNSDIGPISTKYAEVSNDQHRHFEKIVDGKVNLKYII